MSTFHKSSRTQSNIVVGLSGPSGGGKSFTALRLARGLAGDKPFYVIDTENGKSEQLYGDLFGEWYCSVLEPPYTPEAYVERISAAVAEGAEVIVIDSVSDEHDGEGGLMDIVEDVLQRRAGDDARRREALNMAAWKEAKMRHRRLVRELRVPRCHLVVCMRAQDKIEIVKENGKTVIRPKRSLVGTEGWEPICEKRLPFELLSSFLLLPDRPGVPRPIKFAESYRSFISLDKQITEDTGRDLARWAAAGGDQADVEARAADLRKKILELSSKPEEAAEAIDRQRSTQALGEHVAWLGAQYARAQEKAAA